MPVPENYTIPDHFSFLKKWWLQFIFGAILCKDIWHVNSTRRMMGIYMFNPL